MLESFPPEEGFPPAILVVDDSRVARAYVQSFLQKEGYRVLEAADGKEALEIISDDVGVVLLDLWMPEMDGLTCLRHLRESHPDVPAIMITVSHELSHAVSAMKYGAFDYVTKPFDPNDVLRIVKQALKVRKQARRLRKVEAELAKAREHEIGIASRIQQTLLLGGLPRNLKGVKIGDLTFASQKIDGDFYDFYVIDNTCFDVVVGDVMGKGIPAALVGAAAKQHLLASMYNLMRSHGPHNPPSPEEIVSWVHAEMIDQMIELETFFTLCYARFDLARRELRYVDCGHMRTIHYHASSHTCSLLQGVDMPLGFPDQDRFEQMLVPFENADMFLFYSDGLTEARNASGELFGEERLVDFVLHHSSLDPQALCERACREVIEFCGSDTLPDDLTCLALRIDLPDATEPRKRKEWRFVIPADLRELDRMRKCIEEICLGADERFMDEEQIKIIQIVATEVMTNITRHAYRNRKGNKIVIEATTSPHEVELRFYDWGIEFDFSSAPLPVFDGSNETGFGLHIIAHTADSVEYTRDHTGRNCARVTFRIPRREHG